MHAVAAEITSQTQNAVDIAARALGLAFALQLAQGFPRKVFRNNCFFLVSFVAGDRRLKIKTDCTTTLVLEFGQFTDFLAGDAHNFQLPGFEIEIQAAPFGLSLPLKERARPGALLRCSRAAEIEA